MPASDIPEARPVTDSRENTSASLSTSGDAQLCPPNGVSTGVSSVAIDRGLLNFSGAPSSSAPDAMANIEAVSDVDVMQRV